MRGLGKPCDDWKDHGRTGRDRQRNDGRCSKTVAWGNIIELN